MSTIATPTLDEVILKREQELTQLKSLQTQEFELTGHLENVRRQVTLVLTGNGEFDGQATTAINKIVARTGQRKLFEILADVIKEPGVFVRPAVLRDKALETGYQTKAKDFYANVLQLVKSDKRFKVRKVAGSKKDIEVTLRKALVPATA